MSENTISGKENSTATPNSKSNTPVAGTNWRNLDAMSSHRVGASGVVSSGGDRDWNSWIIQNKNALIVAIAIALVALFGGGYFWNLRNSSKDAYNAKIYNFQQSVLTEYAKSANSENLLNGYKELYKVTGNYIGMVPVSIKVTDALLANGKNEDALQVLTIAKNLSSNEYVQFFIATRMAVVYEDLGKNQEAIDVLTKLSQSDLKVFEGKFYLDLGRVYLKMGNKDKAKSSFQYVLDKAKEDAEFVKIAKLHLANL